MKSSPSASNVGPVYVCPLCAGTDLRSLAAFHRYEEDWRLTKCESCGLSFCDPTPTSRQIAGFYSGNYHQELLTDSDLRQRFGVKFNRYSDAVSRHVPKGSRTIDIGCSFGLFVKALADRGYKAEGVEMNRATATWGAKTYGVKIQPGTIRDLNPATQSWELITMMDVLEHTPHPLQELRYLSTLLTPKGYMMVSFPDIESLKSRYQSLMAKLTRRSWMWQSCSIPLHTWEFTPTTATRMFQEAGFKVLEMKRSGVSEAGSGLPGLLLRPGNWFDSSLLGSLTGTQLEFVVQKS
jgi:2-polyprenyl-3-methyl-5-hydroxy-6-metoxy-1,4-benzoquinol methylase